MHLIFTYNTDSIMIHKSWIAVVSALLAVSASASTFADYTNGNSIWFDTPVPSATGVAAWKSDDFSATDVNPDQAWERQSLPIGNGSFGASVLGSVERERIIINKKSLWMGGPGTGAEDYWAMNRKVTPEQLEEIRSNLKKGNITEADSLTQKYYTGTTTYTRNRFGTYTMMGEAYIATGIPDNTISGYSRALNIDSAMVVVQFSDGDVRYQRQYFASYPDSLMIWRYVSEGAPQNLSFSFDSPHEISSITAPDTGSLIYSGALEGNGMQWALRVSVRAVGGGTVVADPSDGTIYVTDADCVEFLLAGDTDYAMNFNPDFSDPKAYVGTNPVATVNRIINSAAELTYAQLYARHLADYVSLYKRVSLVLDSGIRNNISTPERLRLYRMGKSDNALEQLYFQFGRYLLIAASRAGAMPANLQGLWHNNLDGPWRVDYHNNINLQMNYWPAMSTNLAECFTPFIDYVRSVIKPGQRTATDYYGARGWTAEVSANIFGFTAPLASNDMSWNYNPTAGPWLSTQIWEYYDYTRDKNWLQKVGYPVIKGSADFVSDLLIKHNGTYTSAPSYSPEHGTCDLGATYANAVTREVLQDAITASEILDIDKESRKEWREKLNNIYPYQIGRFGQLQEWYDDIDSYGDRHRHTNHLFGLHPGSSINAVSDKDLADACRETLRQRGDAATGWSMGWKLNHWARLLDGDHAHTLLATLLKNGTADNLWDLHPPFQIDGNFGATAGIAEMLLQSHNGELHLLPALPSAWPSGNVTGLRARGNFEVDIDFRNGHLSHALIRSFSGEPCTVRYAGHTLSFSTVKGAAYKISFNGKRLQSKRLKTHNR